MDEINDKIIKALEEKIIILEDMIKNREKMIKILEK